MSKTRRVMASVLAVAATLGAAACTPPRTAHTQVGPTATPGARQGYYRGGVFIPIVAGRRGSSGTQSNAGSSAQSSTTSSSGGSSFFGRIFGGFGHAGGGGAG